jgi:ABC-type spermidine/putrescine transport system permease subunit II
LFFTREAVTLHLPVGISTEVSAVNAKSVFEVEYVIGVKMLVLHFSNKVRLIQCLTMGTNICVLCVLVSTIHTTIMEVYIHKRCSGKDVHKYLSIKHKLTYI